MLHEMNGAAAFAGVSLFNQRVWDARPDRAERAALEAIMRGGFDGDHIDRQVGNYEGQILAIRRGWAERQEGAYSWKITEAGRRALQKALPEQSPVVLPCMDGWHRSNAEYCVYERSYDHAPALVIAERVFGAAGSLAMDPILTRENAQKLRDYLNEWLLRTGG